LARHFRRGALGDVAALDEDATHPSVGVGDRLVDEVDDAFLNRSAGVSPDR
jgi:hypothetical protein